MLRTFYDPEHSSKPTLVQTEYSFPPPPVLKPEPPVVALGDGTIGGPSGQEGGAFVNGISALTKETPESSLSGGHSEKSAACNQEVGSHQTASLLVP